MPSTPAQVPRLGFTLTEMVVVIGILVLLMGLAMPAMMIAMRRSDANSTQNIIANVHMSQVRNARQVGGAGIVYGFSLIYSSQTQGKLTGFIATKIIPWFVCPAYSSGSYAPKVEGIGAQGYISPSLLAQGIGSGIIVGSKSAYSFVQSPAPPAPDVATRWLYTIDFVDTVMPAKILYYYDEATRIRQPQYALNSTNFALHVFYEPGTGFVHAAINGKPTAGVSPFYLQDISPSNVINAAKTNLHNPENLLKSTVIPDQVEIVLYSAGNGAAVNRVILYQNGSYALVGP